MPRGIKNPNPTPAELNRRAASKYHANLLKQFAISGGYRFRPPGIPGGMSKAQKAERAKARNKAIREAADRVGYSTRDRMVYGYRRAM